MAKPRKSFYAYSADGVSGIVRSWEECEARVYGKHARYRGFEAFSAAKAWLEAGAPYEDRAGRKREAAAALPQGAIYCDAGTGGGNGVEVNVADREGVPLLHLCLNEKHLTPRGTSLLKSHRTNNYGELLALLLAIRIASKVGAKAVCSDSALVLDYWSKGHVTAKKRAADPDLYHLALKTASERARFERSGGCLVKVPGGVNPADLGYHKE